MIKLTCNLFFLLCINACFAQTENFWTKKNDFGGLKRERCVALSIDNIGYMGMGLDTNEWVCNDWWAYDAITDTWIQRATLPATGRRNAVAFTIGSKGYVGTGIDSNEALPGNPLKDFWEYDPLLNNWTQKADFPGAGGNGIYYATGFVLDNKGYVVCGKSGPYALSNEVWEYKPYNDAWSQRPDFPGGDRYQMCSFVVAGKAYVGLGADHNVYQEEIWEFNGGNGQWTQKNDFAGGNRSGVTTFTIGERGFVCLGNDGGLKNDLWEYNPYFDSWTARDSYDGSNRKAAAGFVVYGKAYVGTGEGYSGKKSSMYEYTPVLILGINESSTQPMQIYPNPAAYSVNVSFSGQSDVVEILDVFGKVVLSADPGAASAVTLNCGELPRGVYFVRSHSVNSGYTSLQKLIVQ